MTFEELREIAMKHFPDPDKTPGFSAFMRELEDKMVVDLIAPLVSGVALETPIRPAEHQFIWKTGTKDEAALPLIDMIGR